MAGPYFVCSGAAGTGDGLSWVNACVSVAALITAATVAGGEIIYVHVTHANNAGTTISWTLPESGTGTVRMLCVDGGDPAFTAAGAGMGTTVGSLTAGAVEETGGNFALSANTANALGAGLYISGVNLKVGSGASQSSTTISIGVSNSGYVSLENLTLWVNSTSTTARIILSNNGSRAGRLKFDAVSFRMGATGSVNTLGSGPMYFTNCLIHASGSSPTSMFTPLNGTACQVFMSSCDWSLATNVFTQASSGGGVLLLNNCTIATPVTGTQPGLSGPIFEFHACAAVDGANGANILAYYKEDGFGVVQDDQTVYLTTDSASGTQDDGTVTPYSLKLNASAAGLIYQPLYTPWIYVKVASTGSKAITIKCADTEGALLKNSELWMEVEYMGGAAPANSPQSALEGTFPLFGVIQDVTAAGSNLTDTGEAWTGITETGTYTLSKTVTLDEQGYIRCRVALGKDTTNPVYVDPKIRVA